MDNEEPKSIDKAKIFYTILVVVFGWGSLWVGLQGFKASNMPASVSVAIQNITSSNQQPISVSSEIPDTSKQSESTPITTKTPSTSSLTIMIGGDIMMDRGVRRLGQQYGYDSLFASTTVQLFKQADIVVANLEGPITSNPSKTLLPNGKISKELTFTFEPKVTETLTKTGITLLSLANNHTDNFGLSGLEETKKWLSKSGLQWFGDSRNASSTEAVITKNDITVAFVGYHAFQPGFDRILDDVKRLSDHGYFVIVMPHWGTEYSTSSSPMMRSQARSLVSVGASAIIGGHPHVTLEHSFMGDVPVFYSIGNLLFDQYFSPEVMKGNIVELRLTKKLGKFTIEQIKIYETSTASRRNVTVNSGPMDF
ncbi:MAG: CapA family protein [Candidatus Paceibacterota bacterium]